MKSRSWIVQTVGVAVANATYAAARRIARFAAWWLATPSPHLARTVRRNYSLPYGGTELSYAQGTWDTAV